MAILVGYVVSALSGNPQMIGIGPLLSAFKLEATSIRNQVIILGFATLIVFILKPLIVLTTSRILIFRIHRHGATLTNTLLTNFTKLPLTSIKKWSSPEVIYATTSGLPNVLSLLWTAVAFVSDLILILMFWYDKDIKNNPKTQISYPFFLLCCLWYRL
jgi:hypothetical protein